MENPGDDGGWPPDPTTLHVRRAKGGSETSVSWLVSRFSPLLRAQATHRLPGALARHVDPDDLVDEVWLVALPRLHALCEREGRSTPVVLKFLSSTLLNKVNGLITKHLRGARGRRASLAGTGEAPQPLDGFPTPATGVTARAARDEVHEVLREALEGLSPQDREVLVLRGIEQVSNAEVGRLLGLAPSAVTMRYRRALERLRNRLPSAMERDLLLE